MAAATLRIQGMRVLGSGIQATQGRWSSWFRTVGSSGFRRMLLLPAGSSLPLLLCTRLSR